MGCGASAQSKQHGQELAQREVPDGIVLCTATRPDWGTTDYLVFERKDVMNGPDGDEDLYCSMCSDGTMRSSSKSVSSNKKKTKKDGEMEKAGRFFSKRQQCVGTWRITGNVLALVWPFTTRTDTIIAAESARRWINQQTRLTVNVIEPKDDNPAWFQPDVIASKFQSITVSTKQFECPVCYFELHKFPAGVIRLHSRRCCGHYFHKDCAQYLLRAMKGSGRSAVCPLCGVSFSEVKNMPDLAKDPRDWFAVCDLDFGGELDAFEVIEALGTVLPVNRHKLEKNVKAHWHEWDPDGDGTITLQEFITPVRGLKDWIIAHLGMLRQDEAPKSASVPSIDRNPREWFHYWDRDGSGTLEKDEVVRALIRTFCRDENGNPHLAAAHDMLEIAASLWSSLGHGPFDTVTFDEFVRPYGLLDQFIHNQTHAAYFGMDAELIA
jgi:Ca2+-binding EF-hand superfamily protein